MANYWNSDRTKLLIRTVHAWIIFFRVAGFLKKKHKKIHALDYICIEFNWEIFKIIIPIRSWWIWLLENKLFDLDDCAINLFVINGTIVERSPFSKTKFNFCSFKEQIGVNDASLTIATVITNKLIADSFLYRIIYSRVIVFTSSKSLIGCKFLDFLYF